MTEELISIVCQGLLDDIKSTESEIKISNEIINMYAYMISKNRTESSEEHNYEIDFITVVVLFTLITEIQSLQHRSDHDITLEEVVLDNRDDTALDEFLNS